MKVCKSCKVRKETNDKNFYRRFRNQDGWDGTCIECRILASSKRNKTVRNGWMNMFMNHTK